MLADDAEARTGGAASAAVVVAVAFVLSMRHYVGQILSRLNPSSHSRSPSIRPTFFLFLFRSLPSPFSPTLFSLSLSLLL